MKRKFETMATSKGFGRSQLIKLFLVSVFLIHISNLGIANDCEKSKSDLKKISRHILDRPMTSSSSSSEDQKYKNLIIDLNRSRAKLALLQGLDLLRRRYSNYLLYLNNGEIKIFSRVNGEFKDVNKKLFDASFDESNVMVRDDLSTGGMVFMFDGENSSADEFKQKIYQVNNPLDYYQYTGLADMANLIGMETVLKNLASNNQLFEDFKNKPEKLPDLIECRCRGGTFKDSATGSECKNASGTSVSTSITDVNEKLFCSILLGQSGTYSIGNAKNQSSGSTAIELRSQMKRIIGQFGKTYNLAYLAPDQDPALHREILLEAPSSSDQESLKERENAARAALDELHAMFNGAPLSQIKADQNGKEVGGVDAVIKHFNGADQFAQKYQAVFRERINCLQTLVPNNSEIPTNGWGTPPNLTESQIESCDFESKKQELEADYEDLKRQARLALGIGEEQTDSLLAQQLKRSSFDKFFSIGSSTLEYQREEVTKWVKEWEKVKTNPNLAHYGLLDDWSNMNPINTRDQGLKLNFDELKNILISTNNRMAFENSLINGIPVSKEELIAESEINSDQDIFKILLAQIYEFGSSLGLPSGCTGLSRQQSKGQPSNSLSEKIHSCIKALPFISPQTGALAGAESPDSFTSKISIEEHLFNDLLQKHMRFQSGNTGNQLDQILINLRNSAIGKVIFECGNQISRIECHSPENFAVGREQFESLIDSSGTVLAVLTPELVGSETNQVAMNLQLRDNCRKLVSPSSNNLSGIYAAREASQSLCFDFITSTRLEKSSTDIEPRVDKSKNAGTSNSSLQNGSSKKSTWELPDYSYSGGQIYPSHSSNSGYSSNPAADAAAGQRFGSSIGSLLGQTYFANNSYGASSSNYLIPSLSSYSTFGNGYLFGPFSSASMTPGFAGGGFGGYYSPTLFGQ